MTHPDRNSRVVLEDGDLGRNKRADRPSLPERAPAEQELVLKVDQRGADVHARLRRGIEALGACLDAEPPRPPLAEPGEHLLAVVGDRCSQEGDLPPLIKSALLSRRRSVDDYARRSSHEGPSVTRPIPCF